MQNNFRFVKICPFNFLQRRKSELQQETNQKKNGKRSKRDIGGEKLPKEKTHKKGKV